MRILLSFKLAAGFQVEQSSIPGFAGPGGPGPAAVTT
jgi:hypothetical protein